MDYRFLSGGFRLPPAILLIFLGFVLSATGKAEHHEADLWQGLRSGEYFALLRHAIAPGYGDPDNFRIGDCSTQRNLSEQGREQAQRIGERFRSNGIAGAQVMSSQWCRCLDTARELQLGPVAELPALNSLHARSERREPQIRALQSWLDSWSFDRPLVLVSHQATISAFTGAYPRSGELVIVKRGEDGQLTVAGMIPTE